MAFTDFLAQANALLNAASAICLLLGRRAIARRDERRHKRCMLMAVGFSGLFLISYLTRVALQGTHQIAATGNLRLFYLVLLTFHMLLAMALVPLAARTVFLALRNRRKEHRRIARFTYPIWLTVSTTGVMVYVMVYHWPGHVTVTP